MFHPKLNTLHNEPRQRVERVDGEKEPQMKWLALAGVEGARRVYGLLWQSHPCQVSSTTLFKF